MTDEDFKVAVLGKLDKVDGRLDKMEGQLDYLKKDLTEVKEDLSDVKADVVDIKETQGMHYGEMQEGFRSLSWQLSQVAVDQYKAPAGK